MNRKPFFKSGDDWNEKLLIEAEKYCSEIALEELNLNIFPNQIEIVTYEQMLDVYASKGLPTMYNHWSFGKEYVINESLYKKGDMNLAFEIVINSNPCISYLLENNNMTTQLLTIAHAAFGHNHFFKNNYFFREWTDPEGIIDYLVFAKKYIDECEMKYGEQEVEKILNACHTLSLNSVEKYKRKSAGSEKKKKLLKEKMDEEKQKNINIMWEQLIEKKENEKKEKEEFVFFDEENLLYFLEKNSQVLDVWQREICRIVRKISQYFYPQFLTKVMNEGWASFTHYYIANRLYEKGLIDDGTMLEILKLHTNVLNWFLFKDFGFNSMFNPYSLGFEIYNEIKRICENPTKEDEEYNPDICGQDWKKTLLYVVENFRDDSFIMQFLTPNLIRQKRMFVILDDENNEEFIVEKIHDRRGYKDIRRYLSEKYRYDSFVPEITVEKVDFRKDRTLYLLHKRKNNILLHKSVLEVLKQIKVLWGFRVVLHSVNVENEKDIVRYSTD